MTKNQAIGDQYNEVFEALHDALWEHDADVETPYGFPDEALRNASKIFMTVMMDRLWERIKAENIQMPIAEKMAEDLGREMRELVKKHVLVDVANYYK